MHFVNTMLIGITMRTEVDYVSIQEKTQRMALGRKQCMRRRILVPLS
jgi:hypothetical protein